MCWVLKREVFRIQEVLIIQESYMIWQMNTFVYSVFFVSSVNVCNLSMKITCEINVWHGLQLGLV